MGVPLLDSVTLNTREGSTATFSFYYNTIESPFSRDIDTILVQFKAKGNIGFKPYEHYFSVPLNIIMQSKHPYEIVAQLQNDLLYNIIQAVIKEDKDGKPHSYHP